MKSRKYATLLSMLLSFAILLSICSVPVRAEVTELFVKDFGDTPYTGTNPTDGNMVPYVIEGDYGTDFSLEAVINIQSILKSSGRGVKFILRECTLASNNVLEVWIGSNDIWACTNGWKGNGIVKNFNSEPYWGQDLTVRLDVSGDTIDMYLDGELTWSWSDASFSAGGATNITLDGWDSKYIIKKVRLTTVPEKEAPSEEHLDPVPEMGGTKYYVDSSAADGGNGLSPETAWNSIAQVNSHPQFLPDDQILFKRNSQFIGTTLTPKGYGVDGHPIIVDSYGEGDLPVLDKQGDFIPGQVNGTSTVILQNQSWWTFRNIQISNHNPKAPGTLEDVVVSGGYAEFPMRHGVVVQAGFVANAQKKIVRGIVFENVLFEGIDTSHGDEGNCFKYRIDSTLNAGSGGGALCFRANDHANGESRAYIDSILVENCTFHNIGGTAIGAQSGWTYYDSFSNMVVRNNRIYNDKDLPISCTGMYFVSCVSPVAEYNSIQDMTNGIGFQLCTDATAQYNTIVNMDGYLELSSRYSGVAQYWDGCGIDADCQCKGATVFRSNYLENCREGSFAFFDYNETEKALITLVDNISYNCGSFMYYQCNNASYDFTIKNNTVVRLPGGAPNPQSAAIHIYSGVLDRGSINATGNIFYYPNQIVMMETAANVFKGNLYDGISSTITDNAKLAGDPMLVLPSDSSQTLNISWNGSVPGTTSLADSGLFQFQESSPCLKDGKVICGKDMGIVKTEDPTVPPATDPTQPSQPGNTQTPASPVSPVVIIAIAAVAAAAVVIWIFMKRRKAKN